MGLNGVVHFDKCIIDHLAIRGTLDNPEGDVFVNQLVRESLGNRTIGLAASAHTLDHADLVYAYKRVVSELFPDVFMSHGFQPILIASLPFLDAQHFHAFAAILCSDSTINFDQEVRRERIAQNAVQFCEQIWLQASSQGKTRAKEWAFERVKGRSTLPQREGCLAVLVVGIVAATSLVTGLALLI